jgi:hypothetical protein
MGAVPDAVPKKSIRIPPSRWDAVVHRARTVHTADGSKVVNAFLIKYAAGDLDDLVAQWLTEVTGVRHEAAPAPSGTGAG